MYRQSRANLNIIFRPCKACDLQALEWFGMFYDHRNIIQESFRRHRLGTNYMIVAEANSFPVAQVWIDLEKKRLENTGIIWALRVLDPFQRLGIGTDLLKISEDYLKRKKFLISEICVEKDNTSARRLYERLGYILTGDMVEEYSFVTPNGIEINGRSDLWVLKKNLLMKQNKIVKRREIMA